MYDSFYFFSINVIFDDVNISEIKIKLTKWLTRLIFKLLYGYSYTKNNHTKQQQTSYHALARLTMCPLLSVMASTRMEESSFKL